MLLNTDAFAQQPGEEIQSALEEIAEQTDGDIKDDELWQQLEHYTVSPLNLNTAAADELRIFPFLNGLQIQSLIQYRQLLGKFISIYELQAVPQLDIKTIRKLLPYVSVNDGHPFASSYRLDKFLRKGNWQILSRYKHDFERKRGFIRDSSGHSHYLGGPDALFFRAIYQFPGHLSLGITGDRDAGEPFSGNGQKGFDFYAMHISLRDYKSIRMLVVGDYRINLGQGLINYQGLGFGKSSMVMNTDRSGPVLRPHTSAMEYGFYRGAAIHLTRNRFNTAWFVSYNRQDANLVADSLSAYFKGFQSSGYHRTAGELADKNSVGLFSSGGNLSYDLGGGHIALNAVYHRFSDPMKRSGQLYDLYGAEGKSMFNASLDYAFFLRKLYFFGETATDRQGALATVNGLLMSVDKHVDLSLLYRNYSKKYTSLYAGGFGENSEPKNEAGFYLGFTWRPAGYWQLDTYADLFRFPWLKYRVDKPSQGHEYFMQVTYTPSKKIEGYLRYRHKRKLLNLLEEEPTAKPVATIKQNVRLNAQWKLSEYLSLRGRGEMVSFREEKIGLSRGYYLAQDVLWKTAGRMTGNTRLAWFHTDSYDARVYAYENDVRFSYTIPFLYGKGIRGYVNWRINLGKHMSLWGKLSRTWYFDRQTIGSGWDEIEGSKRTSMTLEWIWTP